MCTPDIRNYDARHARRTGGWPVTINSDKTFLPSCFPER